MTKIKTIAQIIALCLLAIIACSLSSKSLAQQRSLWASGASFGGIWPVMRNGIIEAGFKNGLRVRYQAGEGTEASLRLLDTMRSYSLDASSLSATQIPTGLLLAAAPYSLRARVERQAQRSNTPIILIGADTGSQSQPENVLAVIGIDAFAAGTRAGTYARKQDNLQNLLANNSPSLCLRTRSDDPARERICRGIAAGLQKPIAMLNIAQNAKSKQGNNETLGDKSLNIKRLQSYLRKNSQTPLIWLDDGYFSQTVIEASAEATQAPFVIFGIASSQKNIIKTKPQKIVFAIDLRPFEQGQRAVKILRNYLRIPSGQNYTGQNLATKTISLTPRILNSDELDKILPAIGRTR